MSYLKGIDISKWQGNIDFAKVKEATGFAIMKATEGYGYIDPKFKNNQAGFRNAKMPLGYYHFARPDLGNTATKEADWFVKTVGTLEVGEVLALDYEVNYGNCVNWCKAFLDRVQVKTGVKPLLYINLATNNKYNWSNVVKGNYGLWLAIWDGSLSKKPATDWPFIAIKQYGASTKINGISGNVDGDVFFGGIKTFKKYGYQAPAAPVTPPEAPEVTKLKKDIVSLKKEIGTLKEALDDANVKAMSDEITISELKTDLAKANEYKKYQSLYQQAVTALNAYKKGRFMWIVEFLEKTFPQKED